MSGAAEKLATVKMQAEMGGQMTPEQHELTRRIIIIEQMRSDQDDRFHEIERDFRASRKMLSGEIERYKNELRALGVTTVPQPKDVPVIVDEMVKTDGT